MLKYDFPRALFFIIFSSAGIIATGLSILIPEYDRLYELRETLAEVQQSNKMIAQLIIDHEELISHIRSDPNMLQKLGPVTLGQSINDSNVPFAKVTSEKLKMAKEVLTSDSIADNTISPTRPRWLIRCSTRHYRMILFIAGAGLIIVSFACFCKRTETKKKKSKKKK